MFQADFIYIRRCREPYSAAPFSLVFLLRLAPNPKTIFKARGLSEFVITS
jgi:hypothetical protein